ncbi:Late embryoproteinsis abundant protein Lea5-D [Hibiscus syriacus]|uniref:Late embryoproteinsis abundant protein Lea5-D n=1 Tax=Hibiscus syriacus TaxID=106335 RepID=A0A6A3AWK6_HIBSY|nr:Late embryoproteinsis abundant protein Lea5-D [Hibiscus syriacus]
MARSLSSFKLLGASVFDGLYVSISRRGYSAAPPQGAVTASFGRPGLVGESGRKRYDERPGNSGAEIDAAELREMLLNHRAGPR